MNFETTGLTISERYKLLDKVSLIPIGTICYQSGDFLEDTKQIIVNEENQKRVTMFWNDLFFLDKEKADIVTRKEHINYDLWLFN